MDKEERLGFLIMVFSLEKNKSLEEYTAYLEKQFRGYYAEADRRKGITGENLLQCLNQD